MHVKYVWLELLHVYSIDSFFAFHRVELNAVILLDLQTVKAGYVYKEIFVGVVLSDKAETL